MTHEGDRDAGAAIMRRAIIAFAIVEAVVLAAVVLLVLSRS